MTALMYAVWQSSPSLEAIDVLLKFGTNVNEKDESRKTALMYAASDSPSPEVIDILLRSGADANMKDRDGKTALMYAANDNTPEAVSVLLNAGADIDVRDKRGKRAISYAQQNRALKGTDTLKRLENTGWKSKQHTNDQS